MAAAAIKALNGKDFGSKTMKVAIARPEGAPAKEKNEIYTCNLPTTHGKEEIETLFKSCGGEVLEVRIFKDAMGTSRGIACVQMGTGAQAQQVVDQLHDSEQGGTRPLVAKLWENKKKTQEQGGFQQQQQQQYPPQYRQYQHPYAAYQNQPQYNQHPAQAQAGYGPIRRGGAGQRYDANGNPVGGHSASPYARHPPRDEAAASQYPPAPAGEPQPPAAGNTPYSSPYSEYSADYSPYPPAAVSAYPSYPPQAYPQAYPPQAAHPNPQAYPQAYPQAGSYSYPQAAPQAPQAARPPSQPSNTLFVFHVPKSMDEGGLKKLFEPCGSVGKVSVQRRPDGEPKGFGFVEFENIEDAKQAIEKMNGYSVEGKFLKVSFKN